MPQRDCGCGGLVTPTLEQLLAVARSKPLPRVSVRERRAPPAKVGASLKGWVSWQLVDRRGREVRAGEGPNLILDQGLDQVAATALITEQGGSSSPASFFPLIRHAAVGTDSTAPTDSDTGLGTELARTDTAFATETITRPGDGTYEITRFIEFDYDEANGVLTEWGFSSSESAGSNLFNRALFTDSGGSPDAITKTDEEKLRLTYTLQVSLSPVTLTAGSFAVTGVGTVNGDYTLVGGDAPTGTSMRCVAADLKIFSGLARGSFQAPSLVFSSRYRNSRILVARAVDQSGVTYATTGGAIGSDDAAGSTTIADVVGEVRDAYVSGSFQRTGGSWKFDTSTGNLDPIKAFGISIGESYNSGLSWCSQYGYVFDFDVADEFTKDNEHTLTVGVPTVSWGRAS